MGLGGLAHKNTSTSPAGSTEQGEAGGTSAAANRPQSRPWTSFIGGGAKSAAQPKEGQAAPLDDDKKIRFTIGGEGQRMTKEDFIREVQKLDSSTKKQVVDQSNAPQKVKAIAKQEQPTVPPIVEHQPTPDEGSSSALKSTSPRVSSNVPTTGKPSSFTEETPAERKRRLAVLSAQDDDDDEEETPAERRRREAALGTSNEGPEDTEEDSGQAMRIRFAEPERGRK